MARKKLTRRTADKYDLYQQSVQCPEADVPFLVREYKKAYGRPPVSLLEDFCGTALLCCEWVRTSPERTALGIDLDPEPLAWGREHNVAPLEAGARRIELRQANVLDRTRHRPDIRVAFNFSYFLFLGRAELLSYFRAVRASMGPTSYFCLDLHGGPEAQQEVEEVKPLEGFKYVWTQKGLNPLDSTMDCTISFRFSDGTEWKNAFSYHWRLWNLMELRELLSEAGFSQTKAFWEGTEKESGEGNGVYRERTKPTNDLSWIIYLIAYP